MTSTPDTAPSRPAATQRVTHDSPFAVEQEIPDDHTHLAIVRLTDDAARQLARDLTRRHMADLVLLARLTQQARSINASPYDLRAAREVETRLAGALTAMSTTQWVLTPGQTEDLLDDLEDALAQPPTCAVAACDTYAVDGSYCGPHGDVA